MTSASTAVKRLNSESLQQKALTELKQDALELGLTKEDVKQFGNLSHKATWLTAINDAIGREFEAVETENDITVTVNQSDIEVTEITCLIDHPALCEGELLGLAPDSYYLGKDDRGLPTHWALFDQDLRKHAIYSVLKVGDRIPMIIAITLKSPDYLFKNKPKRIKQVPFLSKDNSVL